MAKGKYKKKRKTSHPIANEVFLKRLKDYPEEYTRVYLKLCRDSAKDFAAFYDKFPKKFDNTLPYILFAKQFADMSIAMLSYIRRELGKTAAQVDEELGYTIGYPYASLANTFKKPTNRNLKITFRVWLVMRNYVKKYNLKWDFALNDPRIEDPNEQFDDAVLLANLDDSKNEEQETMEQEHVVKISLNGEMLLLPQNATMFEFLKAVKTRTEQEVTVTRMIETEIEL